MKKQGSVLMEFLMGFPLVLIMIMAVFQIAQLQIARLVIHYAAYCGARAALVHHPDEAQAAVEQAVRHACAWITVDDYPTALAAAPESPYTLSGWGEVPSSRATARKTTATYSLATVNGMDVVTVEAYHQFSLVAPVIGPMIAEGFQWWAEPADPAQAGNFDMFTTDGSNLLRELLYLYPSIRVASVCMMSKPYKTVTSVQIPGP